MAANTTTEHVTKAKQIVAASRQSRSKALLDDPVAFINEDGRIVIVGEDAWLRCAFVDPDRAFPDSWTPLVRATSNDKTQWRLPQKENHE